MLFPEFLGAGGCKMGNCFGNGLVVGEQGPETPGGADLLFGGWMFIQRDAGGAPKLCLDACSLNGQDFPEDGFIRFSQLQRRENVAAFQSTGIAAPDAPDFRHRCKTERFDSPGFGVYDTHPPVCGVFLGKMGCQLGQGFAGRNTDTDGDARGAVHGSRYLPTVLLQGVVAQPFQRDEGFVNGVDLK